MITYLYEIVKYHSKYPQAKKGHTTVLRDWFTPKAELVNELANMYESDNGPQAIDFSREYWSAKSKHAVINQLDFLPTLEGKDYCTVCGWVESPCSHK
jgi:hypothetical protein